MSVGSFCHGRAVNNWTLLKIISGFFFFFFFFLPLLKTCTPKNGLRVCAALKRLQDHHFSIFHSQDPTSPPNQKCQETLKVDMPILTCNFFTFNWLTLTSEMHFVKFHPEVASCLLSRGKWKYVPLGMRLLWKYIRNYFLAYYLISHFFYISKTTKNLKLKLWICNWKYMGFHLISKNILLRLSPGDENVIGIRSFKLQILKISKEFSYKAWNFGKIKFTWLHSVWKIQFTRVPNSAVVRSQAPLLQNKQTNKTAYTHTKWKLSVPLLRVIRLLQLNVCWNSVKWMKEYPFCVAKK